MTEIVEDIKNTNIELFTAALAEKNLDGGAGTALRGMVVEPASELNALNEAAFQATLNNLSIATAEDEYAEALLSNLGLRPKEAGEGAGFIIIITDSAEDLIVRQSTTFSGGGYDIFLARDYIGSLASSEFSEDVYTPLLRYDQNHYYMLVEGSTTQPMTKPLLSGTALAVDSALSDVSEIKTATEFQSTSRPVSLDELRSEVERGLAAKTLGGSAQIKALLTDSDEVSVLDVSVVGMNDPEMTRDHHSVYGASAGGCSDIYVRTTNYPSYITLLKTAERVGEGRFSVMFDKSEAPGFYFVKDINYGDLGLVGAESISYSFGADTSSELLEHRFPDPISARYSAFQNCSVEFTYANVPDSDTEPLFSFRLLVSPNIRKTQDFISSENNRDVSGDYVIKAAVPILTSVEIRLSHISSLPPPAESDVAAVVASVVNSIELGRRFISGAEIASAVSSEFPDMVVKLPVVLESLTVQLDGGFHHKRSLATLEAPDLPNLGATHRTTMFTTGPDDVSVVIAGDLR